MTAALPWMVACASFAVSIVLSAPGLTWLDGGELALAAGLMGVAHPPGEPSYLVLAKLASLIPIGDLPFRLTLFSAASVAAASGLIAWLTAQLVVDLLRLEGSRCLIATLLGGGVAGLGFSLAPGVQLQAIRPELYGFMICLLLLAAVGLRVGGRRGLALAVLPLCMAGAVHHAMLVAVIPGLGLLALRRGKGSLRAGGVATLVLLIPGLLQFAWLPLRSFSDPALDFGSPRDLERILWAVSGAGYARSFQPDVALIGENLVAHAAIFVEDLGWPLLCLGVLGGVLGFLRSRRVFFGCCLLIVVGVLPTALQGLFRADNPDARGYLLPIYSTLCIAAGLGASALSLWVRARAPRLRHAIAPVLGATLFVPAALGALDSTSHSGRFLPARLGAAVVDSAEPGAVLLLAGDSWSFPALYARYWEGRRPDLDIRPLYFLDENVVGALARRGKTLGPSELLMPRKQVPSSSRPEHLLTALVTSAPPEHPIQTNEAFLPKELRERRSARGLLYSFEPRAQESTDGEDDLWREEIARLREDRRYESDPIGPACLVRRYASRATHYLEVGDADRALKAYERGSSLALNPWDLVHLVRSKVKEDPSLFLRSHRAPLLASAETAFMEGDVERAADHLAELLRADPVNPRGLLLAERLYSLGQRVDRMGGAN